MSFNQRCCICGENFYYPDGREHICHGIPQQEDKLHILAEHIKVLMEEQRQDREMIRILWQNGEFTQSVGNSLSEDGIIKRALKQNPVPAKR